MKYIFIIRGFIFNRYAPSFFFTSKDVSDKDPNALAAPVESLDEADSVGDLETSNTSIFNETVTQLGNDEHVDSVIANENSKGSVVSLFKTKSFSVSISATATHFSSSASTVAVLTLRCTV